MTDFKIYTWLDLSTIENLSFFTVHNFNLVNVGTQLTSLKQLTCIDNFPANTRPMLVKFLAPDIQLEILSVEIKIPN